MDFDLSEARVLTLETWETEDGCAIRMELGRKIDTGVYGTQYRRTHTYFLDAEGKLLRLVEDADYEPLNPAAIKEDRRLRVEICVMDTAEGEITEKLQTAQMELLQ